MRGQVANIRLTKNETEYGYLLIFFLSNIVIILLYNVPVVPA